MLGLRLLNRLLGLGRRRHLLGRLRLGGLRHGAADLLTRDVLWRHPLSGLLPVQLLPRRTEGVVFIVEPIDLTLHVLHIRHVRHHEGSRFGGAR